MQSLTQLHVLQRRRSNNAMLVPEGAVVESIASPMTPDMSTPPCAAMNFSFNPRARLLRRTSSTSTLGSIEDEDESEWVDDDIDKLRRIYDRCVDEAALETPFSGVPPNQLLHVIARACQRVHGDQWIHSITSTRLKALEIGRELHGKTQPNVTQATPRPNDIDVEETPKRRRTSRNSLMDFDFYKRDLSSAVKLSNRLHEYSESEPSIFFSTRIRKDTSSSAAKVMSSSVTRLARSMTVTSINDSSSPHFSPLDAHPPIPVARASPRPSFKHPTAAGSASMPLRRPGLYAMPSYGGKTEFVRFNDEVYASLYGTSIASSVPSGFTTRSGLDWSALSKKPSVEQIDAGSSHIWPETTKSRKRSQTLSATSIASLALDTPNSVPEFSWSGSSTASHRALEAEPALASPTPSPYHSGDSLTAVYGSDDERAGGTTRDYLEEGFLRSDRSIRSMASWTVMNPRKHRRSCSNRSDTVLLLDSPFDGDFLKRTCA